MLCSYIKYIYDINYVCVYLSIINIHTHISCKQKRFIFDAINRLDSTTSDYFCFFGCRGTESPVAALKA